MSRLCVPTPPSPFHSHAPFKQMPCYGWNEKGCVSLHDLLAPPTRVSEVEGARDGERRLKVSLRTDTPAFDPGLQLALRFPSYTILHAHPAHQFVFVFTDKASVFSCLSPPSNVCIVTLFYCNPTTYSSPKASGLEKVIF